MEEFNHQVELTTGVMKEECETVLKEFFKDLRVRNKAEKEKRQLYPVE
jgi:tRNA(adenine34) deaminase